MQHITFVTFVNLNQRENDTYTQADYDVEV